MDHTAHSPAEAVWRYFYPEKPLADAAPFTLRALEVKRTLGDYQAQIHSGEHTIGVDFSHTPGVVEGLSEIDEVKLLEAYPGQTSMEYYDSVSPRSAGYELVAGLDRALQPLAPVTRFILDSAIGEPTEWMMTHVRSSTLPDGPHVHHRLEVLARSLGAPVVEIDAQMLAHPAAITSFRPPYITVRLDEQKIRPSCEIVAGATLAYRVMRPAYIPVTHLQQTR